MDINKLFTASKIIEEEGTDGIQTVIRLVGLKPAMALLITHLRRSFGSMNSFPADPHIYEKVKQILEQENLLTIDLFQGEHRWLSNFFPVQVKYKGLIFSTVEHAYQAAKAKDLTERELFGSFIETPADAKKFWTIEENKKYMMPKEEWEAIRISVMENLIAQKFALEGFDTDQPLLVNLLINTDPADIIEGNHWNDDFWGKVKKDGTWIGENNLGKISMQRRATLLELKQKLSNCINEAPKKSNKEIAEHCGVTERHLFTMKIALEIK